MNTQAAPKPREIKPTRGLARTANTGRESPIVAAYFVSLRFHVRVFLDLVTMALRIRRAEGIRGPPNYCAIKKR